MKKSDIFLIKRLRQREHRERTGLLIVEGLPEVKRAAEAGIRFTKLFISPEIIDVDTRHFPAEEVISCTKEEFKSIAFGRRLKGILAVCKPAIQTLSELRLSKKPLILILEGVEKPGNLGTVIRTSDGAGVEAVICCGQKTEIFNQHVVRSSIGALFHVPVVNASEEEILAFINEHQITLLAASARGDQDYYHCDFTQSNAIVLGNEHSGVSPFFLKHAEQLIRIPMRGTSSSLNVAMSASILSFEADRQRRLAKQH